MKILHITNDFFGSKVYRNLFNSLNNIGVEQIIYTAHQRNKRNYDVSRNEIPYTVYSRPILSLYTRVNFFAKKKRIYNDLIANVDLKTISMIHAHTWYSDGAVAYEIYKKYNIPYVVTIRNTDINIFFKYMLHLRKLGSDILIHAQKIIFISAAHKERLIKNQLIKRLNIDFISKSYVIPNGIDMFWLNNINTKLHSIASPFELIYVGKFDKGKNVPLLMRAILELNRQKGALFRLTLIGGTGVDSKKVIRLVNEHPDCFKYVGKINDKELLRDYYRKSHCFVMVSLAETFGLVYVEALSQGLPIIYSKGEGVDGFFDRNYGCAVKPNSVLSIVEGISYVVHNYNSFNINKEIILSKFDWNRISHFYVKNVYKNVIES